MSIGLFEIGHGLDLPPLLNDVKKTAILAQPGIPYDVKNYNADEKTWPSTTNQTLERTATGQQMPAVVKNNDR